MPKTKPKAAARRRARYTGEKHADAVNAIRQLSRSQAWIPTANRDQALLELEFLGLIGRPHARARAGWRPGEDPFGIRWVRPYEDRLDIGVRLRYLPSLLRAILPTYSYDDAEPHGMCGARVRLGRTAVELYRVGLPGQIRLCGLSRAGWWQGLNTMLAELTNDGIPGTSAIWHRLPDRLHPQEEACARRYSPGYSPPSQGLCEELADLASGFLRRHLILRQGAVVTGVDLWMHYSIEFEWFDGPTHQELVDAFTDDEFGLNVVLDERPCTDCSPSACEYSVQLQGAGGARISLRRGRSRAGMTLRDDYNERWRRKRLAGLAEYEGSRGISPSFTAARLP